MTLPTSRVSRSTALDRVHVILVEPGDSRNVGSVARVMSNLGFRHLHLVAPPRYRPEDAATTACWATDLLQQASLHSSLEEAIAPMEHVVGFSVREGHNRPRLLLLRQWVDRLNGAPAQETALVFGPEDTGLRQEHVALCRWLVRIPSAQENPSFNLAQAVLLALHEISRPDESEPVPAPARRPRQREFLELDRIVDEVLTRSRFYHRGTPAPLPGVIKHLLRRMDPDEREMRVLIGMFSKVNKALAGKVPVLPLEDAREEGSPHAGENASGFSGPSAERGSPRRR
jgi:TrmH family RNA methyltransferase